MLVVEVAVAGGAVQTLTGDLDVVGGGHLFAIIATLVALGLSVGCALGVVFPRLARRQSAQGVGLLYFGHLRALTVAEIGKRLHSMDVDEEREQLAAQLEIMARVAWRKHAWLQASIVIFVVGVVGLVLTLALFPQDTEDHRPSEPRQQLVSAMTGKGSQSERSHIADRR